MNHIRDFLRRVRNHKSSIAVVGDSMLDEYYQVLANRISPEFPIIINQTNDEVPAKSLPGGAANVCMQLKNFNVDCYLYSIVDSPSFVRFVQEKAVNFDGCFMPYKAKIPRKKRFYSGDVPLYRWDVEVYGYALNDDDLRKARKIVYDKFAKQSFDAVILSDYNKGLFCDELNWINGNSISIVDPKVDPISRWKNCNIFKPNKAEALKLSGKKDWREQCLFFSKELNCSAVIITQGGEGVNGLFGTEFFEYNTPNPINPASVIGAGDCFVSILGLAINQGFSFDIACSVAYEAGCAYVQKIHNEPIDELDLLRRLGPLEAKFVDPEYLEKRNFKLVFTNGCYDVFHYGHLSLLKQAKAMGDKLCVALNTDESVRNIKGISRPIHSLQQRKELLGSLDFVDFVVDFNDDTPLNLIKLIKPDVLVKGGDYQENQVVGREFAKELKIIPLHENLSSTRILDILAQES